MFLLIYVLDSVSFVMFVYLCIHYYTRFMVNEVIHNYTLHNEGVSDSWGSLTEVSQWVLGLHTGLYNIKLVHYDIYCVIGVTVYKSAFYNQYLPVGIGLD